MIFFCQRGAKQSSLSRTMLGMERRLKLIIFSRKEKSGAAAAYLVKFFSFGEGRSNFW